MKNHILPLALGALTLVSCSSSGGSSSSPSPQGEVTDFDHRTSDFVAFDLEVLLDGMPASGALIQVVSPVEFEDEVPVRGGELWLEGFSNPAGRYLGDARVPTILEEAELIVHVPGARELGSNPESPFEPSFRQTVQLREAVQRTIQLDSE